MGALSLVTRILLHMIVYQRPPIAKRAPPDVHHAVGELRLDSTSCHRKQLSICVPVTTDQLRFPDVHQRRHDLHRPVRPTSCLPSSRPICMLTEALFVSQHHFCPGVTLHPRSSGSQSVAVSADDELVRKPELHRVHWNADHRLAGINTSSSRRR